MPSPTPPERTKTRVVQAAMNASNEAHYKAQRGFTAWIAAIYAFLMLHAGSASVVGAIFGDEPSRIYVKTLILVFLLVPNILLSSLVWSKVYGHKV